MKWKLMKCRQFYHEFIIVRKEWATIYVVGAMLMFVTDGPKIRAGKYDDMTIMLLMTTM